jgi:tRNA A-37 threonylcarbamoyl transferase component Bud32/tetratricopeptide (TPR) repeat protein
MHPGAKVAGRYVIEEEISSQGMGSVFKARDPHGHQVAIKSLHADAAGKRERFSREMETLQDLEHPCIVRYLDNGVDETGTPYFVMEWLDGEDLASHVRTQPLSLGATLLWAGRIAEALGVVHERGIVHRDVKPSNIFLPGGEVAAAKLIDFGIAYVAGASTQLTATGMMMGTPAYMAPEQARGERTIDARADVFALGCVLYESLVGVPPFVASTPMAVLGKILVEPSPRLRDTIDEIPDAVDALVARMMAKERDQRPNSGREIATEIERIVGLLEESSEQVLARHHQRPSVLTRDERRWVSAVVVAAAPAILGSDPAITAPTIQLSAGQRVHSTVDALGGMVFERLADGSLVTIVEMRGAATDQAASAAQLALLFRKEFTDRHVAIATGRAIRRDGRVAGDVIDRAAEILRSIHQPLLARPDMASNVAIWVDELTAELLDGRYEIHQDPSGIVLSGRRRTLEERTLLGRTTPFVGRRREFSALVASIEESVEESVAQAVLVTGPPGCGKSRLMHELLSYLDHHAEDTAVWVGEGEPMHEGSPLYAISDALRRALDDHESGTYASERKRRTALGHLVLDAVGSRVPDKFERIVAFLCELIDLPISQPSLGLRAARQDPRLMGDHVQRACEDLIQGLCRNRPLVLVIDDLQWSDRATVSLIDRLLRNLAESPFMVIAFGRPEIHERFPRIWADRSITELRLGPITKRAAEKLARSMLGEHTDDALVEALVQRASGNAFYLEELLRSAAAGHSDWPESVLAMVEMRIEALEVQARLALRAASVFGSSFWRGGIHALLRSDDVDDWLDRLVERELIVEARSCRFAGEREYRFRHALVREGAYAMLTDDDRRLGHRLAGEWLVTAGEDDPRAIAEQFERGEDLTRALPFFARAAEDAFESSDLESTLALTQRAIACGAGGPLLGKLDYLQGSVRVWQGTYRQAAPLFTQAIQLLPEDSRAWYDAAGAGAIAWSKLADTGQVTQLADQLMHAERTQDESARVGRHIALAQLSIAFFEIGLRERAGALLETVRDAVGQETQDPLLVAYLHCASARYYVEVVGDLAAALQEFEIVCANFEMVGDERQASIQRTNIGYVKLELGLYYEAEKELQEALDTSRRLGLDESLHNAMRLLGVAVARNRGPASQPPPASPDERPANQDAERIARAIRLERQAAAWFAERDNEASTGWIQVILANIMLDLGDVEEARRLARLARSVTWTKVAAGAMLSRIELACGHADRALAASQEAMALFQDPSHSEEDGPLVYLVHAEALHANDLHEQARAVIAEARDELLARAAKIGDPAWQKCFLEHVPDHAHIIERYEAWQAAD